jgi:hypothetical protein
VNDCGWQYNRTGYSYNFIALSAAANEAYARRRDAEKAGQQSDNRLVRFTVGGCRRRPHHQLAVANVEHLVTVCAWLYAD